MLPMKGVTIRVPLPAPDVTQAIGRAMHLGAY